MGASGSATTVKGSLTVDQTLGITGVSTFTDDIVLNGGDITNATTTNANNIFATSTGKTTLGGGAIDMSASGSATTVKGSLTVNQNLVVNGSINKSVSGLIDGDTLRGFVFGNPCGNISGSGNIPILDCDNNTSETITAINIFNR